MLRNSRWWNSPTGWQRNPQTASARIQLKLTRPDTRVFRPPKPTAKRTHTCSHRGQWPCSWPCSLPGGHRASGSVAWPARQALMASGQYCAGVLPDASGASERQPRRGQARAPSGATGAQGRGKGLSAPGRRGRTCAEACGSLTTLSYQDCVNPSPGRTAVTVSALALAARMATRRGAGGQHEALGTSPALLPRPHSGRPSPTAGAASPGSNAAPASCPHVCESSSPSM